MVRIVKLISPELDKEINGMIKKIRDAFGLNISYTKASKIVAEKNRFSHYILDEKKLIKILGKI